jgi:magnesium chelatase subunit I
METNDIRYPEIIGFEEDVIPALDRAILACHDIMLVGQIGQAKTKIAQAISKNLLSPIPIIKGSITNDSPMDLPQDELISLLEDKDNPMSVPKFYIDSNSMDKIRDNKLDTQIEWIEGQQRYKYVLATPDISVKDLVGQIDAIKITKKIIMGIMKRPRSTLPTQGSQSSVQSSLNESHHATIAPIASWSTIFSCACTPLPGCEPRR